MAQATQAELNKFVQVVDEFKANYARLILPATRAEVYASKNSAMISDYESAVSRGAMLNSTIANLVGAWDAWKKGYSAVTDTTSLYIGDAVDWIRGLFGGGPDTSGLSAVQLAAIPAAVAIAGVVSAALLLNSLMNKIFVNLQANKIQAANPGINRGVALEQAKSGLTSFLPTSLSLPMLAAGAIALYLVLGNRK